MRSNWIAGESDGSLLSVISQSVAIVWQSVTVNDPCQDSNPEKEPNGSACCAVDVADVKSGVENAEADNRSAQEHDSHYDLPMMQSLVLRQIRSLPALAPRKVSELRIIHEKSEPHCKTRREQRLTTDYTTRIYGLSRSWGRGCRGFPMLNGENGVGPRACVSCSGRRKWCPEHSA